MEETFDVNDQPAPCSNLNPQLGKHKGPTVGELIEQLGEGPEQNRMLR
jgi:hypothetical protein